MWSWLKANLIVIGSGLALAVVVIWFLSPKLPNFDQAEPYQQPEAGYQVGGAKCRAEQLARIASPVAKQVLTDKCADDREIERQQENSARQGVRAAVAAEQGALETYWQAVSAAVTAGLLVLALWASIWAGVAASQAAAAANKTLEHERRSAERELRPYVFVHLTELEQNKVQRINVPGVSGVVTNRVLTGRISYAYRNNGKTPAKNVKVAARAVFIRVPAPLELSDVGDLRRVGPLGPKDVLGDELEIQGLPNGFDVKGIDGDQEVHLFGRIEYDDEFANGRWTTFHCYIGGDVGYDRTLHTAKTGNDYE